MPAAWNDSDRLKIRALREGWAIPPEKLPAVLERVLKIATDPLTSDRDATGAVKALIAAGKLQLETVRTEMELEEHIDLVERLKRLEGTGGERGPEDAGPAAGA